MTRILQVIALLALTFVSACADLGEFSRENILPITASTPLTIPPSGSARDQGGNINQRLAHIAALEASGEPFVAPKFCFSACTLYVTLSTACFPENGTIGIHSAAAAPGDPAASIEDIDKYNQAIASAYALRSPWLAATFLEGPARTRSPDMIYIPVRELIDRGDVRAC